MVVVVLVEVEEVGGRADGFLVVVVVLLVEIAEVGGGGRWVFGGDGGGLGGGFEIGVGCVFGGGGLGGG